MVVRRRRGVSSEQSLNSAATCARSAAEPSGFSLKSMPARRGRRRVLAAQKQLRAEGAGRARTWAWRASARCARSTQHPSLGSRPPVTTGAAGAGLRRSDALRSCRANASLALQCRATRASRCWRAALQRRCSMLRVRRHWSRCSLGMLFVSMGNAQCECEMLCLMCSVRYLASAVGRCSVSAPPPLASEHQLQP